MWMELIYWFEEIFVNESMRCVYSKCGKIEYAFHGWFDFMIWKSFFLYFSLFMQRVESNIALCIMILYKQSSFSWKKSFLSVLLLLSFLLVANQLFSFWEKRAGNSLTYYYWFIICDYWIYRSIISMLIIRKGFKGQAQSVHIDWFMIEMFEWIMIVMEDA